jgi:7-carboxy-7-deazaguanine synthase
MIPAVNLSLRVSEIFFSLQGETSRTGLPTVFVRLTGCPLRCTYCDTTYAFTGGTTLTLDAILAEVKKYPTRYVCVTGGEPLAQKNCIELLQALCDAEYKVSLETGGAVDISKVDVRVVKVLDIKTPASGEVDKNMWTNLAHIQAQDEIKFVLCDEADYDWAKQLLHQRQLVQKCDVLFSPAQGQLQAHDLADWVLRDGLPVRMQVQLHKILWGNERAR